MSGRRPLYEGTPYAEPRGFWRRLGWWVRQDYLRAEQSVRDQRVRESYAREIAADLREEFPPSDVPGYIDRVFGGAS